MRLSISGSNLKRDLLDFCQSADSISVFVAYIKKQALEELLNECDTIKQVCVRWQMDDLINGASDIEIYELLSERGIPLYRNERLHLKAFVCNDRRAFLTSANLSSRALMACNTSNYNYEIGSISSNIVVEDLLYFHRIINESVLVTERHYDELKVLLACTNSFVSDEVINYEFSKSLEKEFLLSSLPMSNSVFDLYDLYTTPMDESNVLNDCAIHDIVLYGLEFGLTRKEFYQTLNTNFFKHPFIVAFLHELDNCDGQIYFGRAKEWIQSNCTNVPTPRRWEITENIQILYNWFVNLGEGKYAVDVPGRHSQRLYRVK